MQIRVQLISIAVTGGLFLFVFELVRRKRLHGALRPAVAVRHARSCWACRCGGTGSSGFARLVGIDYAPSALFAMAFGSSW